VKNSDAHRLKVVAWMGETGRVPTTEDVMRITGLDEARANIVRLGVNREARKLGEGLIQEIRDLIGKRLKQRLEDDEKPMSDSNLVQMTRYIMPAKQEQQIEANTELKIIIEKPKFDTDAE